MQRFHATRQKGFTLIEMIVSLGLFSVVITIAVGALLVLINTNLQLQAEQTVMTNLSFALDSMTREIRTGTQYYCREENNPNAGPHPKIFDAGVDIDDLDSGGFVRQDCSNGRTKKLQGVTFVEGGNSITGASDNRILYYYDEDEEKLFRKISDYTAQAITSDDIEIIDANFFVTGSTPQSGGGSTDDQPAVTVLLTAQAANVSNPRPYVIQTTITQRAIDI